MSIDHNINPIKIQVIQRGLPFGMSEKNNEIGIFVVTRSTDRAQIKKNNITGNRQYNVKLGWQQPGDVTLPNNWWGSLTPDAVIETFLDHKIDVSLGHVSAPEPLTGPVNVSDWQKHEGAAP